MPFATSKSGPPFANMEVPLKGNDHRHGDGPTAPDGWLLQESVWKAVEDIAAGHPVPHPLAVELHLGTACNLACPECISRPTLDTEVFEPSRAIEIAGELVALQVRSVVLSGGGEPLLHPAAGDVMRTLADGGAMVSLVTNGTLLHHHMDAVATAASRVWVSVDAATAETHALFRPARNGVRMFEQIVDNLRVLSKRRDGRLTFSFLLLSRQEGGSCISNASEIVAAAKLARELGCGTFEVNIAFDRNLQVAPAHGQMAEVIAAQLREVEPLGRQGFKVYVNPMVEAVAAGRAAEPIPKRTYPRCLAAEFRALIGPRGVFLCPRHQELAAARFGDPVTTSLLEIWGSDAHLEALRRVDPRTACDGPCMSMELNEKLIVGVELVRGGCARPPLRPDDDLFI